MAILSRLPFVQVEQASTSYLHGELGVSTGSVRLSCCPLTHSIAAAQSGTLLRGQPYLSELAWERGFRHGNRSHSLVGMIHTLAPPKVRELIGEVLTAPVQPWDALVCTSPAVRDCVDQLLDRWQVHLEKRFGGTLSPRPQLPLIPLGVDQTHLLDQRFDISSREFLRRHLRLGDDDLMVLWLGRLSFLKRPSLRACLLHFKKLPSLVNVVLTSLWLDGFPGGESDFNLYKEAAQHYSPDVPVHFLDGKNSDVVRCCWAAADIFLSLVDNPQETFGLAPVEAMAAGVPVVVSDWDGYQYTVSDGVEGFRISTLSPGHVQQGEELALQHDYGQLAYQDYVGAVAQHVAVDTDEAAAAIVRLSLLTHHFVSVWARPVALRLSSVLTGP